MFSIGGGVALFTCYTALLEQILCVMGYSNVSYFIFLLRLFPGIQPDNAMLVDREVWVGVKS